MTLARRFRNVSLKWKLSAAFVTLGLLPMAAVIYVADASAREEQQARCGALLGRRAAVAIEMVERACAARHEDVQAFAFNPLARGTPAQATAAADHYTRASSLYDLMVVADRDGTVIAVNTVDGQGKPVDTSALLGRSVKDEDWFQACVQGRVPPGECFARDLYEDKWVAEVYRTRGLALNFAAPVRDESGKVVRVWSGRVSWARAIEPIFKTIADEGAEAQLLSRSGLLLTDYDPKAVLSFNLRDAGLVAAARVTEGKSGFVVEEHKRRKVVQVNAYAASKGFGSYKGFGWGVLVRQDLDELLAASIATRRQMMIVAALGGAILFGAALWLGGSIVAPIRRLMTALREVAKGDLTQQAHVTGGDEVGQMAAAFDATVAGIRTALKQDHVNWEAVGQQREQNTDLIGQLVSVERAQATIAFKLDGTVLTANENFLATMGYRLDEIRGRHHRMFVDSVLAASPEYRDFWAKLNRGEFVSGDFKRLSKSGQEVWLRASYNPILDPVSGKPYKIVKFATDITAQKLIEERVTADAVALQNKVDMIVAAAHALAGGDFTVAIPDLGADAVGQMARSLNEAVASVRAALERVQEVSEQLADASAQLSSASTEISSGAQEQASSLEETAGTLQEITATIRRSAEHVQQARQLASGSKEVAEKGGQVVSGAVGAMSEINESSKKIAEIITTIDEIAFQTNLLALNAAVEAARAGEQGRGFAVVATEVRNLAQRSATAAKEIKGLIQDSVKKVDAGTELVNKSGNTLAEIVTSVKRVTDIVTEIAAASREQSAGIDQVNKAVSQMDTSTQRKAAQTEELSATAQALNDQATQLRDLAARFKLNGSGSARSAAPSAPTSAKRGAPQLRSAGLSARHGAGRRPAHQLDASGAGGGLTDF
ncbi:methyl-accepting chemotaxis protein [Gemmata sp. JC673]|uniref:Methyl-accepting chemotaxis protein n=1 Tax=Gemmata algarum TaxID=2975278 RepID=A0ABU5F4N1_9BACT|nr:methyl-accepting chemotaxis protein [Gemmata algarum]MDY3562525.1 methyl-accepting chemotaxis protein [Gemmata algarum]